MRQKQGLLGVLAFAGLISAFPATPGRVIQTVSVSATVPRSALVGFEVVSQPVTITQRDVDRGYIEVVMKSRLRIRGAAGIDATPGMVLAMEPRMDLFKSVRLAGGNGDGQGNGHSVSRAAVIESNHPIEGRVAEFRYRFELAQAARPGEFGTAISVSVDL